MTISRWVVGALLVAVAAVCGGCDAPDQCGAGTVSVDGACVPDGTQCGPGTIEVDGECMPDGSVICETGTTFNVQTGKCVPDIAGCAVGTVLVEDKCVSADAVRPADVEEAAEPNDAQLDSDGFATFELPAVGQAILLHGCIDPYRDTDADGQRDPDFDAFVFAADGPTLLDITVDGVGGTAGGFEVIPGEAELADADWERFGINLTSDTTQQQVFLPTAGRYTFIAADSRSLLPPALATGGEHSCYYATVANAVRPIPTPISELGKGTLGGDVQFWSYDPESDGAAILTTLRYSSASAAATVSEMVNDEYRGSTPAGALGVEIFDNLLLSLSVDDEVVLVVEPITNFSLDPVETALTVVAVPTTPLPVDGAPMMLTQNPTSPTYPFNLVWIRASAGDMLRYQFDAAGIDYDMQLYPPRAGSLDFFDLQWIANVCTDCAGGDAWVQLQETGYYYFYISNRDVLDRVPYGIRFAITVDTPTVLVPGIAASGTLGHGDRSFFDGTVADVPWIEFAVAPTNFTNARVTFYDRDAAGRLDEEVRPLDQGLSSSGVPFGRILDGVDQRFLISVENDDGRTGTETFNLLARFKQFADAGTVDDAAPVELDAVPIAAGQPTFVFLRGRTGDSVRVTATGRGGADLVLEQLDRVETSLFARDEAGGGAAESLARVLGDDAIIAMQVSAAGGGAGSFDLDAAVVTLDESAGTAAPAIAIPDDDSIGVDDTVALTEPCAVAALTVDVKVTHTFRGDVRLTLTSPSGTQVTLKATNGDSDHDILGTFPTTLEPVESLDAFIAEDATGDWTLNVADLVENDVGTFNSWRLNVLCM